MASLTPLCADTARERGDPLHGTALHVSRFLLIEHPGPWAFDALAESGIDADVLERLLRATSAADGRTLLIRRHGRVAGGEQLGVVTPRAPADAALVDIRHCPRLLVRGHDAAVAADQQGASIRGAGGTEEPLEDVRVDPGAGERVERPRPGMLDEQEPAHVQRGAVQRVAALAGGVRAQRSQ